VQPKFAERETEFVPTVERVLLIPSLNSDGAIGPKSIAARLRLNELLCWGFLFASQFKIQCYRVRLVCGDSVVGKWHCRACINITDDERSVLIRNIDVHSTRAHPSSVVYYVASAAARQTTQLSVMVSDWSVSGQLLSSRHRSQRTPVPRTSSRLC